MMRCLLLLLLCFPWHIWATTVAHKIYIQRDSMTTATGEKLPYLTFGQASNTFEQRNSFIELQLGDSLDLWVVNQDTTQHQFAIKRTSLTPRTIAAGDSVQLGYLFQQAGVFLYYDNKEYPKNSYLGLAGIIYVRPDSHPLFHWNIKEHQASWNHTLGNGGTVNWNDYNPDYFTLNGNSNPQTNNDTTARVVGHVGDTLILCMANTGRSIHALHFHGYHVEIKFSSKFPSHVGRSKDSVPIYPMESVVVQLVPDKTGEYPVHDHNLVAVSANDIYPNGMFTTLLIAP